MGFGKNASQAVPEEGTFDWYVTDAAIPEDRSAAEPSIHRSFKRQLNQLVDNKYPKMGDVHPELIVCIRDALILSRSDKGKGPIHEPRREILAANSFVFQLALRDKRLLHACRAPELDAFWRECLVYEDEKRYDGKFPPCPKGRNIFDHMMGVHLKEKGEEITREVSKKILIDYKGTAKSLEHRQAYQKAMGFFIHAVRFGSVDAAIRVMRFYRNILRLVELPKKQSLKLFDAVESLIQTLPVALGSYGYILMARTYCCLSECMMKYGEERLGLSEEAVNERAEHYDEALVIGLLKAERLRFHEPSNEVFDMAKPMLDGHIQDLSPDKTSPLAENTQAWHHLIVHYMPRNYFLNDTGHALRHDGPYLPAFDGEGKVNYNFSKLLKPAAVPFLSALGQQAVSETLLLERVHDTLHYEPFADALAEAVVNLDLTQPTVTPFYATPVDEQTRHTSTSSQRSLSECGLAHA